jgi:hypothetical protein
MYAAGVGTDMLPIPCICPAVDAAAHTYVHQISTQSGERSGEERKLEGEQSSFTQSTRG